MKELERLTLQWREACQDALQELHEAMQQSSGDDRVSMEQLLRHLQIDNELVGYSPEDDSFNTAPSSSKQ